MRSTLQELTWKKLEEHTATDERWTLRDFMRAASDARYELATAPTTRVGHLENSRPRSSDARDRRTRDRTAAYFREELAAHGRAFSKNPLPLDTPSQQPHSHANDDHPSALNDNAKPETKATARRKAQDARDTRAPADWKRTRDTGKLTACNRVIALGDHGTARTFTLNLSPDVVTRGLGSSHSGFASWMQKRIHNAITGAVGRPLPFVFGVDVTRSGRPHLHGMIAANDDDLAAVSRALRKAGGLWKAGHSEKQTHFSLVWDSDGWTRYGERNLAAARRVVGPSVIAGTGSLKSAARKLHEKLRNMAVEDN